MDDTGPIVSAKIREEIRSAAGELFSAEQIGDSLYEVLARCHVNLDQVSLDEMKDLLVIAIRGWRVGTGESDAFVPRPHMLAHRYDAKVPDSP